MMLFSVNLFLGVCSFHTHLIFLFCNLAFESLFSLHFCYCDVPPKPDIHGAFPSVPRGTDAFFPPGRLSVPHKPRPLPPSLSCSPFLPLTPPSSWLPGSHLWLASASQAAHVKRSTEASHTPGRLNQHLCGPVPGSCLSKSLQLFPLCS